MFIPSLNVCSACGIKQVAGKFYYSHNNTLVSKEELASKVCTHARSRGKGEQCINKNVEPKKGLGWFESEEEQRILAGKFLEGVVDDINKIVDLR